MERDCIRRVKWRGEAEERIRENALGSRACKKEEVEEKDEDADDAGEGKGAAAVGSTQAEDEDEDDVEEEENNWRREAAGKHDKRSEERFANEDGAVDEEGFSAKE